MRKTAYFILSSVIFTLSAFAISNLATFTVEMETLWSDGNSNFFLLTNPF